VVGLKKNVILRFSGAKRERKLSQARIKIGWKGAKNSLPKKRKGMIAGRGGGKNKKKGTTPNK